MIARLRHNLLYKMIALAGAIVIWAFVGAERTVTKQVMAEVVRIGAAPDDIIVEIKPDPVPVEVTGPRNTVDAIGSGLVKARVDISPARPTTRRLRVAGYDAPQGIGPVAFREITPFVPVTVVPKIRRRLPISSSFSNRAPYGKQWDQPRLAPAFADIVGAPADVERVEKLEVYLNAEGVSLRSDVPIRPLDREGLPVREVSIDPPITRAEIDLVPARATRVLVVDAVVTGRPAPPFVVGEVVVEPTTITVAGSATDLDRLTNIATTEVSLEGLKADLVRTVALVLPPHVTVLQGPTSVVVTVRVRDSSRPVGRRP